ncbi:hypothetical protein GCM10010271_74550 [Streptomyces kurssanovii]|nr:hypothetical protein GCM10010271_74550 [Streptomyces kurssanovii]
MYIGEHGIVILTVVRTWAFSWRAGSCPCSVRASCHGSEVPVAREYAFTGDSAVHSL